MRIPRWLMVIFVLMGLGLVGLGAWLGFTHSDQSVSYLGIAVAVCGVIVEALALVYQARINTDRTPPGYTGLVNFDTFKSCVEHNLRPGTASIIFKVPSQITGKNLKIRPICETRTSWPGRIQRYNDTYNSVHYDVIVALFEGITPRNDCDYEIVSLRNERIGKVTVRVDGPGVYVREVNIGELQGVRLD